MSLGEFVDFIRFALKKKEEELLFQRWISGPQFQMSYNDFVEQLKPKPLRDDAEILNEVRAILAYPKKGGRDGNI